MVPSGTPVTSPASAGVSPQTSHRSAASRNCSGSASSARVSSVLLLAARERVARVGGLGQRVRVRRRAAPGQDVVALVRRDPVEPGRDARAAVEARQRPIRRDERLLQRVLGVVGIAADAQGERVARAPGAVARAPRRPRARRPRRGARAPRRWRSRSRGPVRRWARVACETAAVRTDELDYALPEELIAQRPAERTGRIAPARAPARRHDRAPALRRPRRPARPSRSRRRQQQPRAACAHRGAPADGRRGRGPAARGARRRPLGGARPSVAPHAARAWGCVALEGELAIEPVEDLGEGRWLVRPSLEGAEL